MGPKHERNANSRGCLKPKRVTGPPQLHAFSDGGEDAYGSCVFIRWPMVCGIEIRFVTVKAFVAPLMRKTTPWEQLPCPGWWMK